MTEMEALDIFVLISVALPLCVLAAGFVLQAFVLDGDGRWPWDKSRKLNEQLRAAQVERQLLEQELCKLKLEQDLFEKKNKLQSYKAEPHVGAFAWKSVRLRKRTSFKRTKPHDVT